MAGARTARNERRRSSGEGSVYETAEGWRGALTWTDDDGVRHRRVVRGTTSQGARDKLDDLRRELKLGTITPAGTGTVAEYLSEWLERERTRIRPSTWRGREQHVRGYLIPAFGKLSLARPVRQFDGDGVARTWSDSCHPWAAKSSREWLPIRRHRLTRIADRDDDATVAA